MSVHTKVISTLLSLPILSNTRYMTDHMSVLTLGVLARFVTTHDLPGICAAAIQAEPWRRERGGVTEVWRDGLWNKDCGGSSSKIIYGEKLVNL